MLKIPAFKYSRLREYRSLQSHWLGTNQTKYAVIWMKKRQKGRFLKPEKLQDHGNEEKGKD